MHRATETYELFSYHYFGNILQKEKIAFDGICVKALLLAGASAPSDADDAGRHRQD